MNNETPQKNIPKYESPFTNFKGEIIEGIAKNGKAYFYIEIYLTETLTKRIFLENAEVEVFRLTNKIK